MRVLQIPNYQYPHIGGIEQTSRDISNALANCNDIEQKIICFNEDAKDGQYVCHRKDTVHDSIDGVEVIRCGCFAKVASQSLSISYPQKLYEVMKSFKPDVVVFHYPNPFVASLLIPLLPSDTVLVIYWHLDIVKQKILGRLFKGQSEALCKRANRIVATSPNYARNSYFLNKYGEKVVVIPSCIQEGRLQGKPDTAHKTDEIRNTYKGKTICYAVGRHVQYKGMEYLIRASRYLDDSFVVLVGGTGELTEQLKKLAMDDPKVKFLGRVKEEDMVAYYRACDIFCFPSITKNEAFGLSLAEAMYFGKPTVTFTIQGSGVNFVSLNGVTGIECPNRDYEAYAKAIMELQHDPEKCKELGNAARQRCCSTFMFEQYSKKIVELFRNVYKKTEQDSKEIKQIR